MKSNAANQVEAYTQNSSKVSLSLHTLIDVRHDVMRHQGTAYSARSDFPGQRTGKRRGQGLEFVDLRQYDPSDDVRHIDWNVTARSNEPYTRLFREEREYITTVVVDLRPPMFTGSDKLRSVSAGLNAALILWQANESGDRCASMVISAAGIQQSRPVAGSKGVLRALQLIRGRSGNYFFLSGFDTADDKHWRDTLAETAMTSRLKAILLLDKLEQEGLPAGTYQYRTRKQKVTTRINSDNQKALIDELRLRTLQRQVQFTDAGIPLLSVSTELTSTEFMAQIINLKLL